MSASAFSALCLHTAVDFSVQDLFATGRFHASTLYVWRGWVVCDQMCWFASKATTILGEYLDTTPYFGNSRFQCGYLHRWSGASTQRNMEMFRELPTTWSRSVIYMYTSYVCVRYPLLSLRFRMDRIRIVQT